MLYIGIDPGASGGIAILDERATVVRVSKMPATDRELFELLPRDNHPDAALDWTDARAVIERVWSSPQMGVASSFKFGTNVGACKMALAAAGIPYDEVVPSKWQTFMGCRVGKSRAAGGEGGDKNITKRRAQALFPGEKVTHAIADALLIAEFTRRINSGAQVTPTAPQKGLFDHGEETRATAGQVEEGKGATQAAAEVAAGHDRPRHRGNRKGRA